VVPAWVAVVTSLGAAAVAAATAIVVAWLGGRDAARREEAARRDATMSQLREWRQGVAANYASHFLGAWVAVRHATASLPLSEDVRQGALKDARWLVNELPTFLGPVLLMFGKGVETAAQAAREALEGALVRAEHADSQGAEESLRDCADKRAAYDELVRDALHSNGDRDDDAIPTALRR